ncbi:MAG TPA: hypothetical protein VGQ59_18815, partial [Cyclobacteriaceae bacterium]|nr:hypothetical protein [Cyclobacteriaceae bacterium]
MREEKGVSIKIIENYVIITPAKVKPADKKLPVKPLVSPSIIASDNLKINQNSSAATNVEKASTNSASLKIDSLPKQEIKKEVKTTITDSTKSNNKPVQISSPTANSVSTNRDSTKRTVLKKDPAKENDKQLEKKISASKLSANK